MQPTEYTSPDGTRYLVLSVSESISTTGPDGTPIVVRNVTARRWIKSRNDFAKTANVIGTGSWERWTAVG